ncbi:MAG TPA: hypothetical protein VH092_16995, partial [Urbifossiella sp.]|nr:hypothetical protein [Urbifossiella sp.]
MTGPGVYLPDPTEGITRPEDDLPPARFVHRRRVYRRRPCPRYDTDVRRLFDIGDHDAGCSIEIHMTHSRHRCPAC